MVYASIFGFALLAAVLARAAPPLRTGLGLALPGLLLLFTGMRGHSTDYEGYELMYDLMLQLDMDYPERFFVGKDLLFGALIDGVQRIGGRAQAVFLAAALLSIGLKHLAFSRALGGNTALAWLVTLCVSFFLHDFTQIRTAIAVPLCFLALQHLLAGRTRAWLGLGLLAGGFHLSALVFLPIAAVLLVPEHRRVVAWLAVTAAVMLAVYALFEIVGTVDHRLVAHGESVGLNLTAMAVGAFKLALLVVLATSAKRLPPRLEALRQVIWPCVMFVATGLIMLILFRSVATALAFRLYEFFDAFAVWVVLGALLQRQVPARLLAVAYCAFALLLQVLPGLFTDYKLAPLASLFG